jgi:malonyl-CoA/methylmalonyl-CoA synthetase
LQSFSLLKKGLFMPGIALVERAKQHADRTAVIDASGELSYSELLKDSARVSHALLETTRDLDGQRVAYMIAPGCDYVTAQWGIWRAGGVAVPLALMHPAPELRYYLQDSGATRIIAGPEFVSILEPLARELNIPLLQLPGILDTPPAKHLPDVAPSRPALIIYTSGTTGKPKGVVITHANLDAQITALIEAWEWTPGDRIVNVLPLHHIHGILNVTCCALWAGASVEMAAKFDADAVWDRLAAGGLTLFMAVPTIYARLVKAWDAAPEARQRALTNACRALRLMVSGSAALPVATLERWRAISGHVLLERYGMSELGMALSNPLRGSRRAGYVGMPLPRVEVRIVDESCHDVPPGQPGTLLVRGPAVFSEYLGKPEATAASFHNGWFITGDVAVCEDGWYRLLGRASVDIIKTGGFKVSALEIEAELREHLAIDDCAVVGVPDPEWGERVCAAIIAKGAAPALEDVRAWAKARMAPYKIPSRIVTVKDLPRNAMGKVVKPEVCKLFEPSPEVITDVRGSR